MKNKKTILFLCTGNSCRSQMAEGWAKHFYSDKYEVFSAGIEKHGLNQIAVKVMKESGIDISKNRSKAISDVPIKDFDYVVTVCGDANETCPIFPAKVKKIHVGFDDPPRLTKNMKTEDEILSVYRRVCIEIKNFIIGIDKYFDS